MNTSIKTIRLLVISSIILFSCFFFYWWGIKNNYNQKLEISLIKERNKLDIQKNDLTNSLEGILVVLENKADPLSFAINENQNDDFAAELINMILKRKKSVHAAYLLDLNGKIIYGNDREILDENNFLVDIKDDNIIQHADIPKLDSTSTEILLPNQRNQYISPTYQKVNQILFNISIPIEKDDSIIGILFTQIDVNSLWNDSTLNKYNTYLTNSSGEIISTNNDNPKTYPLGKSFADTPIFKKLNTNENNVNSLIEFHNNSEGEEAYALATKVPDLNWLIITEIQTDTILNPIYSAIIKFSIIFFITLFLVIFFINFLIKKMSSSIDSLSKSFSLAQKGDYNLSKYNHSIYEFKSLQIGFNAMITTIINREKELRKSEKKFKTIFNSYVDIYYETDLEGKFEILSPSVFNLTGYTQSELIGTRISDKYKEPQKREELLSELKEKGRVENFQSILFAKDNSEQLMEANVEWRKDKNNKISGIIGTVRNINDREKLSNTLKQLNEKETLLKEIHHRVKNNLQIISGIIHMKGRRSKNKEVQIAFDELKLKIKAIALIHEKLYQTEHLSSIDFCSHTESLFSEIQNVSVGIELTPKFNFPQDPINVSIDQAVPLGLITNELITNAIKYGITKNSNSIAITLKKNDDSLFIEVKDNGPGLPENFSELRKSSLGYKMIDALVGQLDSKLIITSDKGTSISFEVKLDSPDDKFPMPN